MPHRETTAAPQRPRLRVMASMGVKAPLQALVPRFERETGQEVEAHYASSQAIAQAVTCDTAFDVLIVTQTALSALSQRGVRARPRSSFGTTLTSLAFPAHEPSPDLSRIEALADLIARARVISMSDPARGGSSSRFFLDLAERRGLGEAVRAKALFTGPGEGAVPVHDGRADLGVAQASEVALTPGLLCIPLAHEDPQARSEYLLCLSPACQAAADLLGSYLLCAEAREIRRATGLLC